MRVTIQSTLLLITIALCFGQIPNGYYDSAKGLTGEELQQALHDIIDDHQQQSYSSLWTHFQATDKKANGKVWDMYSDVPGGTPAYEFTFGDDQDNGSGGTAEGQKYNREHSWPSSWFKTSSTSKNYPMYSDLFHLVPTDKYVNAQRGNFPYGEVLSPSWTSTNGSKLGPNTFPGYSGTVFEPIDEYKGDFARGYLYMSTRYLGEDSGWLGSPMTDGAQLQTWALNMILGWHESDTVSSKEINRNEAVFNIQGNRNPFIDNPEYAWLIWGSDTVSVDDVDIQLPVENFLVSAYPNPFNPSTLISLENPELSLVKIDIYDVSGRHIHELVNEVVEPGTHTYSWTSEPTLPSGIYMVLVSAANQQVLQRITLLR